MMFSFFYWSKKKIRRYHLISCHLSIFLNSIIKVRLNESRRRRLMLVVVVHQIEPLKDHMLLLLLLLDITAAGISDDALKPFEVFVTTFAIFRQALLH